jgi:hypothetical protein
LARAKLDLNAIRYNLHFIYCKAIRREARAGKSMLHMLILRRISKSVNRNSSKCESEPILDGNILCYRVSSQWKSTGRVERANQTLQDRLVKELRLRDINTIEAANAYTQEFMADFNARFAKAPRNSKDLHRPLAEHEDLDGAMCHKEVRKLSQALTLRYDKVLFILDPTDNAKRLAGTKVVVCDYPDGRLEIMHESTALPYKTFDTLQSVHRSEIVENKRLDAALALVAEMQEDRDVQRSQHAPRRAGQEDHMFGIPDGSLSNGYQKRGCKPGRRTDFMNDPAIIARREQALAKLAAAE